MKNRVAGHQGVELAKSKAGVSRAGVSSRRIGELRAEATFLLMEELRQKINDRNLTLQNIIRNQSDSQSEYQVRARQLDIDTILWIITCCGLVEVDEQAQRIAACPEDYRATLSEVLGTSQRR